MKKIIDDLKWRYATKKFDPVKKVSDEKIEIIKDVINLAPTSYGLQPFQVLIVENKELRNELVSASFGQEQVKDASHLIIFCAYKKLDASLIEDYIQNIVETREISEDRLVGFKNMLHTKALGMEPIKQATWMAKQTYIALGQLMVACAHLRVDAVPMEGFDPVGYDKILNLSAQNLVPTLVVPIGYRHDADPAQHNKKVRRKNLFKVI